MVRPIRAFARLIPGFSLRHFEIIYFRQVLPWQPTEPTEMPKIQVLVDTNPNDTTARFFGQRQADLYVTVFLRLELDMPDDGPTARHDVVTVRIELRPEDLDISDTAHLECPKHISDKDVLDDMLAES
jgi:hypothetical protein